MYGPKTKTYIGTNVEEQIQKKREREKERENVAPKIAIINLGEEHYSGSLCDAQIFCEFVYGMSSYMSDINFVLSPDFSYPFRVNSKIKTFFSRIKHIYEGNQNTICVQMLKLNFEITRPDLIDSINIFTC